MKQLVTLTLFAFLVGCTTGCESTPPAPVKIPALPTPEPKEAVAKFAVGDNITVDTSKKILNGVILAVGPMGVWENIDTKTTRISRAYQIRFTVPGKMWIGILPEFALRKGYPKCATPNDAGEKK